LLPSWTTWRFVCAVGNESIVHCALEALGKSIPDIAIAIKSMSFFMLVLIW
jgi:hypothetical protein